MGSVLCPSSGTVIVWSGALVIEHSVAGWNGTVYCPTCGKAVRLDPGVPWGDDTARWPDHIPGIPQTAPGPDPSLLGRIRQIVGNRIGPPADPARPLPDPADEAVARGQAHQVADRTVTLGEVRDYWNRVAVARHAAGAATLGAIDAERRHAEGDEAMGRWFADRHTAAEAADLDAGYERMLADIRTPGPDLTDTTLVVEIVHDTTVSPAVLAEQVRRLYNLDSGIVGVTVKTAR